MATPRTATHPSTMVVRAERLSLAAVIVVPVVTLSGQRVLAPWTVLAVSDCNDMKPVSGLAWHTTASRSVSPQPPYVAPSVRPTSSVRTFETLSRVVQEVEQSGAQ